jgi:hypothetical protein
MRQANTLPTPLAAAVTIRASRHSGGHHNLNRHRHRRRHPFNYQHHHQQPQQARCRRLARGSALATTTQLGSMPMYVVSRRLASCLHGLPLRYRFEICNFKSKPIIVFCTRDESRLRLKIYQPVMHAWCLYVVLALLVVVG